MEVTCRVYRPRKPRDSPLFQLVERHLEELLRLSPILSIGPIASFASAFASVGSAMSGFSIGSALSWRSRGGLMAAPESEDATG